MSEQFIPVASVHVLLMLTVWWVFHWQWWVFSSEKGGGVIGTCGQFR